MFGHVPVRSGQQKCIVGGKSSGAPRLGAIDHPLVAAPLGAGDHPRQIRAAAGLRKQLDEHLVTAQRRRNVLPFLLFAAGVEDRRATDGEGRDIENQRHFVASAFGVERLLILDIQPESAVLGGEANPGEPAVVEPSLQFADVLPRRFVAAVGVWRIIRVVDARHVLGEPRAGPLGERRDRFACVHRCCAGHDRSLRECI